MLENLLPTLGAESGADRVQRERCAEPGERIPVERELRTVLPARPPADRAERDQRGPRLQQPESAGTYILDGGHGCAA